MQILEGEHGLGDGGVLVIDTELPADSCENLLKHHSAQEWV